MKEYLSLIRFAHTVFALPFALVGYFLGIHATHQGIQWGLFGLVVLCMVFARSAAMAFNRYADMHLDEQNVRTNRREIPTGVISPRAALLFVVACALLFVATTYFINTLCFYLSPVALAVILGYSYTKRFTALSHFVLGLGLALAPVGAYLAVTAEFDLIPCLLGAVVLFWVGGFDIIYAMQDVDFDKEKRLYSVPVWLGPMGALRLSTFSHLLCALLLIAVVIILTKENPRLGWLLYLGAIAFLALLWYQHRLVKPHDLSRVNLAFFTTNGIASIIFGTACILDFYM
ncbi:MAG TPA: UbiA-like polyprenyltransferase [Saprospiraceae bacterium]|nr:UbiA-like polyprenyltransferase [Saprospiraceae bacterium]